MLKKGNAGSDGRVRTHSTSSLMRSRLHSHRPVMVPIADPSSHTMTQTMGTQAVDTYHRAMEESSLPDESHFILRYMDGQVRLHHLPSEEMPSG